MNNQNEKFIIELLGDRPSIKLRTEPVQLDEDLEELNKLIESQPYINRVYLDKVEFNQEHPFKTKEDLELLLIANGYEVKQKEA